MENAKKCSDLGCPCLIALQCCRLVEIESKNTHTGAGIHHAVILSAFTVHSRITIKKIIYKKMRVDR